MVSMEECGLKHTNILELDVQAALRKGTLAWRRVVAAFGKEVLQENGEIDRTRLGAMIFSDPGKRRVLNNAMSLSIGMGLYWELFKHWIKGTKVVIMDVPLLFEAKLNRLTKPVIVVWVDSITQEVRLVCLAKDQFAAALGCET
ncbi:hypothetical protein GOP47_0028222 [Adiantum capillus-veneris]|nr:hypothetical protein GOP47_0028222 [Adiantum capillus-veneris]